MKEMEQIQQNLNKKLKSLKSRIEELGLSDPFRDPDHLTDNAAIDTDVREQIGHDTIEAEIEALTEQIVNIEEALARTFNDTYGVCTRCGQQIAQERLDLIPEAEHCIDCHKQLFA